MTVVAFSDAQQTVINACFAYFNRRREELKPKTRIAYYTTSETALRIIQNGTFWLRNPELMNDYQEVVHGQRCLESVLADPDVLAKAAATVDAVFPGFFADLVKSWRGTLSSENTLRFVACLSEIDATDDRGRLSMWRACSIICQVKTHGLSSDLVRQKGLLAARIAMAAVSLPWKNSQQALERMNLIYDAPPRSRHYAVMSGS